LESPNDSRRVNDPRDVKTPVRKVLSIVKFWNVNCCCIISGRYTCDLYKAAPNARPETPATAPTTTGLSDQLLLFFSVDIIILVGLILSLRNKIV